MSRRTFVTDSIGSRALDVTSNTEYVTEYIPVDAGYSHDVYVEFYSDQEMKTPVTPTAGNVNIKGSPLGSVFLESSGGSDIDATLVSTPDGLYAPVVFDGMVSVVKATFTGITGASYAKVVVFSRD